MMVKRFTIGVIVALAATGVAQALTWGDIKAPSTGPTRVIGGPASGCIAGAAQLPTDGPGFQAIRVQRNRHYGHPDLVAFIQRLGQAAQSRGLEPFYVGDMAQPRGGPMASGHGSHQSGLDADIWFNLDPKPKRAPAERQDVDLPSMVLVNQTAVDPAAFGDRQVSLLRLAATDARVDRIFVHWTIKRALCDVVGGDRSWLRRVRPWYGHMEHFHVRLSCPAGSPSCVGQATVPPGEGCDSTLDWWFDQHAKRTPAPPPPAVAAVPPRPKLPAQCSALLK
jgi:penicillin-insensitive murein DD-endopeptidase